MAIVGAGLIGLFCARALATRGACVRVYDRAKPGRGASWAAAGMLAPAFEAADAHGAHPRLFDLCMSGLDAWRENLPDLGGDGRAPLGYRPGPTLAVSMDDATSDHLARLEAGLARRSVDHDRFDHAQLRSMEPAMGPKVRAGVSMLQDARVDNRAVVTALLRDLAHRGIDVIAGVDPLFGLQRDGAGWRLGDASHADLVLETTGWRAPDLTPIKGVALALGPNEDMPDHVIRFGSGYIVAHRDRIVLGASEEPGRSDTLVDPATVRNLLNRASRVCPAITSARVLETWAGVRPATPDRAPAIGWNAPGHYVAAGHYRNGVLLAPLTGAIVARHMLDGVRDDLAAAFDPARFAPAPA